MTDPQLTSWTLVDRAAAGESGARSRFAHAYLGVVRRFLAKRWRGRPQLRQLDDAVQEVFLDLFRSEGALSRVQSGRGKSFRGFLYGVVDKVARRHEERWRKAAQRQADDVDPDRFAADQATMSRVFDREWAICLLLRARVRMTEAAQGEERALRRIELLSLRFSDNLPIRRIAELWGEKAARLHKEYAKAREEFKAALMAELSFHHPGTAAELERECRDLLDLVG